MKTKAISIQISNPCHQIWENMDINSSARFCNSCQESVVDFTEHSNAEIVSILLASNQKVCGRLTSTQLHQLNHYFIVVPTHKNWLKYLGVLAIGLSLIATDAKAINLPPKTEINPPIAKRIASLNFSEVKKIYGFVVDENDKALAGIRVVILNTKLFAQTDKNGRYEILLTANLAKSAQVIAVESLRYEASIKLNSKVAKQINLKVFVTPIIMGKIAISKKD